MRDYSVALEQDYDKLINSDSFYYSLLIRHQVLTVAAGSIMHENITRIMQLADRYQMDPSVKKYFSLHEFLFAGYMGVRIGDLTLIDCLDRNVEARFAPHQIYQFLVESEEIRANRKHNQVLASNRDFTSFTKYPNSFKRKVDVATTMVSALTNSSPDSFDAVIGTYGGNKEVTERARKIVDHVDGLRQHIYRTLLDPASAHFPGLKNIVEYYLTQGRRTRISALNIVGLKEVPHIYELYRRATLYPQQGISSEFYTSLAHTVKDYAQEVPEVEGVLTEDDLFSIIDTVREPAPLADISTAENFSQVIGQIFSKTPVTSYEVAVDAINWYQMIPPHRATLSFYPNTPKRFSIKFDYQNEEGEALSLSFRSDLRKSLFDWTFIETAGETPEFLNLNRSLLFITRTILLAAQGEAQAVYDQRQRDKVRAPGSSIVQVPKKEEKERPDPAMPRRTDVRREIREHSIQVSLTAAELEEVGQILSSDVKKQIIIPPVEEQSKMLRKLSYEDQARVFPEIRDYNGTQAGKFLPLKRRGPNGEILWSCDISSRVPGRIRVLATPVGSGDKVIRFKILDIDYRRNIYRNWNV